MIVSVNHTLLTSYQLIEDVLLCDEPRGNCIRVFSEVLSRSDERTVALNSRIPDIIEYPSLQWLANRAARVIHN